jgi:hypothetical protein
MPETNLQTCVYHILRYTPNLIRDEWINIGVLLHWHEQKRFRLGVLREEEELGRLRRLHPEADLDFIRALDAELSSRLAENRDDLSGFLAKLDATLSNVLQLGPQKAVLTENAEAEFDRLYRDHVAPPRGRARSAAEAGTRSALRTRINATFRSAGVLGLLERNFRVDDYTYRGDPMRLDYAYRKNGTRGFMHALALGRDPAQAKALAFTAEQMRSKIVATEFAALTEVEPRPENERHEFVRGLLSAQGIQLVPLTRLAEFANRLRPELH